LGAELPTLLAKGLPAVRAKAKAELNHFFRSARLAQKEQKASLDVARVSKIDHASVEVIKQIETLN